MALSDFLSWFKKSGAVVSTSPGELSLKNAYNADRDNSLHGSFCFAPSVNMLFSTDGSVKACCHNKDFSMGKYPEQSIAEIWRSIQSDNFRKRLAAYDLSEGCKVCEFDFKGGNYAETSARHFDTLPRHKEYPTMMEFWLNNTCNLECVMCTGELSSSIRKNREKLPALKSPYDKAFVEQLREFIPHLKETRFSSSGEAFLIDLNFDIWDLIIALNPDCIIMVQTNGTVLNGRIKDYLQRGNFKIGVSLDSLNKENYESIRKGASFDRVMDNIEYFNTYNKQKGHLFNISTCVMPANWQELPDFVNYCNKLECQAVFHKVFYPEKFALNNLPASELSKIAEQLGGEKFAENSWLQKHNAQHYRYFVSVIEQWAKEAPEREGRRAEALTITFGELVPAIRHKFEEHIITLHLNHKDSKELLDLCMHKVDALLHRLNDDVMRESVLRRMYMAPARDTIGVLKNRDEEYLLQRVQKFMATEMG